MRRLDQMPQICFYEGVMLLSFSHIMKDELLIPR